MKIKNLVVLPSIILLSVLSSAFRPAEPTPNTEIKKESFAEFLSHFDKVELPFEIKLSDLNYDQNPQIQVKQKKVKSKGIFQVSPIARTKFIPEVANGRFSRMGPPTVHPVARFFPTEKTVAVIYTVKSRFTQAFEKTYRMVIFDLEGNIIGVPKKKKDELFFPEKSITLAFSSGHQTLTCKIDQQKQIWLNTYDNEWEKDVKKNGFNGNEIVSFDLKETKVFKINQKGLVDELKEIPSDARASLN